MFDVLKSRECRSVIGDLQNTIWDAAADAAETKHEMQFATYCQRAGGKDAGSLRKLLQINKNLRLSLQRVYKRTVNDSSLLLFLELRSHATFG